MPRSCDGRKLRTVCCNLIVLLLCAVPASAQQALPANLQPLMQELDKAAASMIGDADSAGLTLGIVTRDGLVWTKSYGFADIDKQTPANADTVYRIGSITKQFTGLMLLQLVHAGKVKLTDPVEKYFPEINLVPGRDPALAPITLQQLATHMSGLDREPGDIDTYTTGAVSDWEKTLIAALPHTRYIAKPGEKWSYSNIGYAILGAALSRAAHQPYTDYVRQHILAPLGMTHSDFEATLSIRKNLAVGYTPDDKGKLDSSLATREQETGRGYKVPNGALYTTVGDLARFEVLEMLNGPEEVLPRKELEDNFTRQVPTDASGKSAYGIGFVMLKPAAGSPNAFFGHSGSVAGYVATAFVEPSHNVGIIVLHSALSPNFNKLVDMFINNKM